MEKQAKILITGANGLIGKALHHFLINNQYENVLAPPRYELDLRVQQLVFAYFKKHQPEYVFHLAAMVGGIKANATYTGQFIYDNTQMHCNVIEACRQVKVRKLLFPGSACSYPKHAEQPIKETAFLTGPVEPTNIAYAAAKINGIVMCQAYHQQYGLSVVIPMPTNAYGINDHFDEEKAHVIPSLFLRFANAKINNLKSVSVWGTGKVTREFIYADDLAHALYFLMCNYNKPDLINVGTMEETSIAVLAESIAKTVGYQGNIIFDSEKPDGAPRKLLDSAKFFDLGWRPTISLERGLQEIFSVNQQKFFAH